MYIIYIQEYYNTLHNFAGRAGYTLDELFTNIRSQVLEQRRIGLSILANILARAKEGFYDTCVNPPVVQLVVSGQSWADIRFSFQSSALHVRENVAASDGSKSFIFILAVSLQPDEML